MQRVAFAVPKFFFVFLTAGGCPTCSCDCVTAELIASKSAIALLGDSSCADVGIAIVVEPVTDFVALGDGVARYDPAAGGNRGTPRRDVSRLNVSNDGRTDTSSKNQQKRQSYPVAQTQA